MKTTYIFLSLLILLGSGCSMQASLEPIISEPAIIPQDPAKTTGLVAGSMQTGTASGDGVTYSVQSTVGNYMSGIEQTTSDKSYKVYSSVQGAIVSD